LRKSSWVCTARERGFLIVMGGEVIWSQETSIVIPGEGKAFPFENLTKERERVAKGNSFPFYR